MSGVVLGNVKIFTNFSENRLSWHGNRSLLRLIFSLKICPYFEYVHNVDHYELKPKIIHSG